MNEISRPTEKIRINTRNSYLNLNWKKQYWTKRPVLYWTCYVKQNCRKFKQSQKFEYFQT